MLRRFEDRRDAGRMLAARLAPIKDRTNTIVIALPRGGVPVAYEVAKKLHVPLDVLVVRKLGIPGREELAFGAVAPGGIRFVDDGVISAAMIPDSELNEVIDREERELTRRERLYRGVRPPADLHGKTVILVDDGLATGSTMRAAITAVKKQSPEQIIVGVPVAARETCEELRSHADVLCVCLVTPRPFYAVGLWYMDFSQTTDQEVQTLLTQSANGSSYAKQRA